MIPQWGLWLLWVGSGFPVMQQPLGGRGHEAATQAEQWNVAFPNTSLSHDDRSLACYFCHLVISMACLGSQWLWVWRALSPVLSSQDRLDFTSSGLINPWFPKLSLSHLGSWTWLLPPLAPASSQLKVMRKTIDRAEMSALPILPSRPWLRGDQPVEFSQLRFMLLVVVRPSLLQAQLKETYGPRFSSAYRYGTFPC